MSKKKTTDEAMAKDPRTKVAYRVYNDLVGSDLTNEDLIEVMALTFCFFIIRNLGRRAATDAFNKFLEHCSRLMPTVGFVNIKRKSSPSSPENSCQ